MVKDTEERGRNVAEGRRVGEVIQKEIRRWSMEKGEEHGRRKQTEENQ